MWLAEVCTQWVGSGAEDDANRPSLGDDHALARWEDVTGQPSENLCPVYNLYIVKMLCEKAVLDAIEADANYLVLWSEEEIEDEAG